MHSHVCTHTKEGSQEEDMCAQSGCERQHKRDVEHTCQGVPYTHRALTLPGSTRTGPTRTCIHVPTQTRPTNTWRRKTCAHLGACVCEQGHTGPHADDPQVCVCSAVPWCPSLHPLLHAHSCPKGLGTGYQSPLWLVPPILPSPCSFQLDLSPEADLGISVPCF